jgi:hypothetical protein
VAGGVAVSDSVVFVGVAVHSIMGSEEGEAVKTWLVGVSIGLSAALVWGIPKKDGYPFDGFTGFTVSNMSEKVPAGHFTVSAWVRLPDVKRSQMFLTMGKPNQDFSLYLYNDAVRLLVEGSEGKYGFAEAKAPQSNEWTHYVGTYDGKTAKIFRDGALEGKKAVPLGRTAFACPLTVGFSEGDTERILKGSMTDIRVWNRVLAPDEVKAVYGGEVRQGLGDGLLCHWNTHATDTEIDNECAGGPCLVKVQPAQAGQPPQSVLQNKKADGFRGIWYFNQPLKDEYVYKYSGGLGTYCSSHSPFAWYAPAVNKTFFCYGGTDASNSTLLHMVSYYDHATGKVARPTLLLDKKTDDAHDNPVINLDDQGYLWIFSSSHGRGRPSYISRSVKPYDIDQFQLMWTGNYSYPQPMYYPGKGFLFIHTWYVKGRGDYMMTSNPEGTVWSERKQTSYFEEGHYQISAAWKNRKTGVAFNMHPKGKGLNYRTNLYYMESDDFGETWKSAKGETLATPLTNKVNAAQVLEYQSKGRNVYLSDIQFDSAGRPIILFVLSKGFESGPANGPREWRIARWTGHEWKEQDTGIASGSNYDVGPVYIESDSTWRIIGPTQMGPQPYNPGGEIAMWLTENAGATWRMVRQMTQGSELNHTYVRRPVNANPEFYGFWADGHGRKPSESRLYFCNQKGDVFRLPQTMAGEFAAPERVFQ